MNETLRRILDAVLGRPAGGAARGRPPGEAADHAAGQALLRLERLAQIGRMTAAFAHDVRTPLHVVASTLETALERPRGRPPSRADLRAAQRSCRRISAMLADILEFAKGERGSPREEAVERALCAALSLVEAACAKRGIRVRRRLGRTPPVMMRLRDVEGVFFNLLTNALDAMPGGGTLTVGTSASRRFVCATVRDTGPGMPAEALARIATPGYTTKETGSGMGLYLSREVLAEHRGELLFESKEGRGTAVTLRFKR